jgi:hypothetical protein
VEIFFLLRYFTVSVGVLLQIFGRKWWFHFQSSKSLRISFLACAVRIFVIISELLQCHTLNLVQG